MKQIQTVGDQFSFKISPTMAAILEEQGEAEFEIDGKYYTLFSEEKLAQAQQEAVERGRQRTIEIVDMMRKDASLASRLNHPSDVYYYLLKSLKKEQE